MNNWINKIGLDKFAHFGIGGLICALFTFVFILQDLPVLILLPTWRLILCPLMGTVVTFFVSVIKEVFFDNEFDWKDIIAALTGCGFVYISVVIGVLFNFLSNLT